MACPLSGGSQGRRVSLRICLVCSLEVKGEGGKEGTRQRGLTSFAFPPHGLKVEGQEKKAGVILEAESGVIPLDIYLDQTVLSSRNAPICVKSSLLQRKQLKES